MYNIKIEPTEEQINTYAAMHKATLVCAAERALLRYFDLDISSDLSHPKFEIANGFPLSAAINPRSEHYLLDEMVEEFESRMAYYNGEISENACWEMAIEKLTNPLVSDNDELYISRGKITSCEDSAFSESFVLCDRDYTRLVQTTGAILAELSKTLPDGDYNLNTFYEGRSVGYIDSDEGTAVVKDGELKIEY